MTRRAIALVGILAYFFALPAYSISFEQFDLLSRGDLSSTYGVTALDEPNRLAAHPSSEYVFVASRISDTVSVFKVNDLNLSLVGSARDGRLGVDGLNGAVALAVSPDGRFVYVTGFYDGAIAVFEFNEESETLTYVKNYKNGQADESGNVISGLSYFWGWGITDIKISPNGDFLYVSSNWKGGAFFKVNKDDGTLQFLGAGYPGFTGGNVALAVSEDSTELAVLNVNSDVVVIYTVDPVSGQLAQREQLKNNQNGVVALDYPVDVMYLNERLYVASHYSDSISVFEKQAGDDYQQIQVITRTSLGNDNVALSSLNGARSITIGVNNYLLHLASNLTDSITSFEIDQNSGLLTHFDTSRQGESLNSSTIDGLSDPWDIEALPKVAGLVALSKSGDSISVFQEEFPATP